MSMQGRAIRVLQLRAFSGSIDNKVAASPENAGVQASCEFFPAEQCGRLNLMETGS